MSTPPTTPARVPAGSLLLEGRTAVVTGAAQGLGLATARRFAEHGAHVLIADVDAEAAHLATKGLADARLGPGQVLAAGCDVTDDASVRAALDAAVAATGRLDVVVNNAGITRDASMRRMSEEMFTQVLDVHLRGTWLGTKHASDVMAALGHGGAIVNVSSISGKVGMFGQTNYSAAKAGIIGLSKAAAKEVAKHRIRVNVVQPGLVRTPMTEAMPPAAWEQKMAEIPLGRAGEPDEVADVVLFLASPMSSYLTGNVVEVAGGRFM
ncbi:3-oxoacyl-ACP reductase FabG [Nocardioides yefusunii]|uniref:3-oxoacyl-ACP reductase FabG n=1 Tax=Nocardioides yefusunii TaxID=2500546 RepID=A0ABW1QW66_9ACTN|nr:3-oxoacyl-ACP reductase FabG [Nocardioides yefusunii]